MTCSPACWTVDAVDTLVRVAGAAVAVWGGLVLAVAGAFLTPFRIGTVLVPVSVVLVVLGNVALVRFTYAVTGSRLLALLPGVAWFGVSLLWAARTTEGDLVLYQTNWVATVYLLAGCLAVASSSIMNLGS
jgi:hypothetical protein